ncbi:MAG TPA: hypothetical protein VKE40_18575 [Gemmataceae bacterium]|nr:hypothetical protein [Gemmataceae bacterium]
MNCFIGLTDPPASFGFILQSADPGKADGPGGRRCLANRGRYDEPGKSSRPGDRMSHDKLRHWLKLTGGPWPPDHYALIGLKPGQGSAAEIESRILERLEMLRQYQLPHPDEATEGMNLLARALDTLTDPDARQAYDRSLGIKPAAAEPPPPPPVYDILDTLFPGVPLLPASAAFPTRTYDEPVLPDVIPLPQVLDEPDIDDDPEVVEDVVPDVELPEAILVPTLPAVAKLDDSKRERPARKMSPKRELYAELARVRKVLRVWERARPYLVDTERTFARQIDALALMGCLAELRPLLPTVTDLIGTGNRPGGVVAALARQRLMFDTFRSLLPSQREALAKDFRAAHYRLAGYYDDLRDEVRRKNEKDWYRAVGKPFLRHLADYPEWLLVPVALIALAIAVVRSV